jgi:signal transduction histidine kinase/tetratricopeptide (TPR) repeat protein
MDLFATDEEIVELEERLARSTDQSRFELMTKIAWFLRQSDSGRALALADQVHQQVAATSLTAEVQQTLLARIQLVVGETNWLLMALADAEKGARSALEKFESLKNWRGCADAHWLLAWVAVDSGNLAQRDIEFERMANAASRAGDQVRLDVAQAALARWSSFSNAHLTEERYSARFELLAKDDNPIRSLWSNEFLGILMYCKEDLAQALSYTIQAHKKAIKTGQLYFAIVTAVNIADNFSNLNEHLVALDWIQRGLNLARQTGWPRAIGHSLLEMSEVLRQIKNIPAARDMLNEALTLLAPINESRAYALALSYQGSLSLDLKEYEVALEAFRQLEIRANALKQVDFQVDYQRGQAHALSFLGRPDEAIKVAQSSLKLTQEQGEGAKQIDILMMMADIYFRHPDLIKNEAPEARPSLSYLYQALSIAENIPGYIIPGKLYEMLSLEYAATNDFPQAFSMSGKAIEAIEKAQSHETITRASTIQVLHELERVREDGEYHRQIAISEARRSKELQQINTTLEQLGAIGREITTHLDQIDIFNVLNKYVHVLLDINVFKIYLASDNHQLVMEFCVEDGKRLPVSAVPIDSPVANSARCFRDSVELLRDFSDEEATHIPGTLRTLTGLYFPLSIGEHKLGVLSVESVRPNAFSQRELLIFRSLCAYAAIGFDNAHTYQQLQNTQKQLVYHEKMAALGSIVAGVAHELNTPIGNGMLLASSLHDRSKAMVRKFTENAMRRSELATYLDDSERAAYLIVNSFQTAADLVMSFKQVSVDQTTAQRRQFDLKHLVDDIVATMRNQFTTAGITIDLDIPDNVPMDSYPGPLSQVVMNLMQNSLLHAFDSRSGGCLKISGSRPGPAADRILIQFSDNGNGISPDNLGKIFDPFFTTKLGLGGNGLGLSISYNIVKSILRGEISVESEVGRGTTFTIDLPLDAPTP